MPFKAAKCPNCAGDIQVPDDRDSVKCMYCGSDIIVREAIKAAAGINVENLFNLAKSAFEAGNFQEALDYYTRVLEVDAKNYEAWLGKGLASGWMSTLANCRINETLISMGNSINVAPGDIKEQLQCRCSTLFIELIGAYYSVLDKHVRNSIMDVKAPLTHPQTKADVLNAVEEIYINVSKQLLTVFGNAIEIFPKNLDVQKKAIDVFHHLINGYDNDVRLPDSFIPVFKNTINATVNEVKLTDHSYEPPVEKTSSSACFIATATMGNTNHPTVTLLREFRDTWLLERKFGQLFIKYYYKIGPYLAMIIDKWPRLKSVSYIMVIRPIACIANLLLRNKHTKVRSLLYQYRSDNDYKGRRKIE